MSKKRWLDTKFWSDSYVEKLDPVEKLLFIYLMTNERSNVAGVYELPLKFMAVETGIERSMLETVLARFERDKKVIMYDGWVWLVNAVKHQNVNNDNIKAGMKNVLKEVPTDVKRHFSKTLGESSRLSRYLDLDLDLDFNLDLDLDPTENASVSSPTPKEVNPEATRLASMLQELTHLNHPYLKKQNQKQRQRDLQNWSEDIERLNRIDGYDYPIIEAIIKWSQDDDFWKRNIRSGTNLRKKFDKLLIDAKVDHDSKSSRVVIAGQQNGL